VGTEIERKFLIGSDVWRADATDPVEIIQGYIAETGLCSIRVRIAGDRAWLNLKEMKLGARRGEFEYEVPAEEGRDMLRLFCDGDLIEKTRHRVRHGDHVWEIDEFAGSNLGLTVAEVELGTTISSLSKLHIQSGDVTGRKASWLRIGLQSQRLECGRGRVIICEYQVSTARLGAGEENGSQMTPRGMHVVSGPGSGPDSRSVRCW
jgi:adenylate cyclase